MTNGRTGSSGPGLAEPGRCVIDRRMVRFRYTAASGPFVLLLHPVGLDLTFWDGYYGALVTAGFAVLAPDFRGHGGSAAGDGPFELDDLADDCIALARSLRSGAIHVIGVSMGGMVAQVMAIEQPAMVASLVLANSCCTFPDDMRPAVAERGRLAQRGGMEAVAEQTLSRWFTPAFLKAPVVDEVRQRLLRNDPATWSHTWQAIARLDVRDRLTRIDCPALVMTGTSDVSTPPAVAYEMVRRLRRSTLTLLPQAPHMAALEQPEAFLDALLSFLRAR